MIIRVQAAPDRFQARSSMARLLTVLAWINANRARSLDDCDLWGAFPSACSRRAQFLECVLILLVRVLNASTRDGVLRPMSLRLVEMGTTDGQLLNDEIHPPANFQA
jgi:hypothetical protein